MTITSKYERYLDHFGSTCTLQELAAQPAHVADGIALRHDIDHDLDLALEMARLEHDRGIRATYFVLHTARYWKDPDLHEKLLQLQDYGHEVGLHVNVLSEWFQKDVADPEARLRQLVEELRSTGVRLTGTAAHGDRLCYAEHFINYWCFAELRPGDPATEEDGRTAEGIRDPAKTKQITYPASHKLQRSDGAEFPFWSVSMKQLDIAYEAWRVPVDGYFSDSGGGWTRTADPLERDLRTGRHQVLIHPVHWRGLPRTYFFLSAARSGSKWMARFLDSATPLSARHEYMLNQEFHDGDLGYKRTGADFAWLAEDLKRVEPLIADAWTKREAIVGDYAEVNVYLEPFTDLLKTYFPDATFVMLHRDPRAVVRSILGRNWYDTPVDPRHRRVNTADWEKSGQFARACHYVADVNRRLAKACPHRIAFEDAVNSLADITRALESIGIIVHPRLAARLHGDVVNATGQHRFSDYQSWTDEQRAIFHRICGATAGETCPDEDARSSLTAWLRRLFAKHNRRPSPTPPVEEAVLADSAPEAARWRITGFLRETAPDGTTELVPDPALRDRNRHVVLGGSAWSARGRACSAKTGWAHAPGGFLSGEIAAHITGGGQLTLFSLGYDRKGRLADRRQMATLTATRGQAEFALRLRADMPRFDLALYASKDSPLDRVRIENLRILQKPLARDYAEF